MEDFRVLPYLELAVFMFDFCAFEINQGSISLRFRDVRCAVIRVEVLHEMIVTLPDCMLMCVHRFTTMRRAQGWPQSGTDMSVIHQRVESVN